MAIQPSGYICGKYNFILCSKVEMFMTHLIMFMFIKSYSQSMFIIFTCFFNKFVITTFDLFFCTCV